MVVERPELSIRLVAMTAIGPFAWRWPAGQEAFERGWAAVATVDGREFRARHGIGRRAVYGRSRVHSVTWVEGEPVVEGVEADDFDRSECLLSLIKVTKRHLRPGDAVPAGYASLPVVVMADEAAGPYSLAVKLRQDDVDGWTRHALLRAAAWGRLRPRRQGRVSLPPVSGAGPAPAVGPPGDAGFRDAVAAALLAPCPHDLRVLGPFSLSICPLGAASFVGLPMAAAASGPRHVRDRSSRLRWRSAATEGRHNDGLNRAGAGSDLPD